MDDALYNRYGLAKVTQIIPKFYSEVLESPRLRDYFDGVHIRTLVDHQSVFMATAMGGSGKLSARTSSTRSTPDRRSPRKTSRR